MSFMASNTEHLDSDTKQDTMIEEHTQPQYGTEDDLDTRIGNNYDELIVTKKRKLNDGTYEESSNEADSLPLTSTAANSYPYEPAHLASNEDYKEYQHSSYTNMTPSKITGSNLDAYGTSSILKKRPYSELPELTTSIVVNQNKRDLQSIENIYEQTFGSYPKQLEALQMKYGFEDPVRRDSSTLRLGKTSAKAKYKEEMRIGKLSMNKEVSLGENREHNKTTPRVQDYYKPRYNDSASRNDSLISNRKAMPAPQLRGESRSVSKFLNESLPSWPNRKEVIKPKTPGQADNFQFKAKPMPRFVTFEPRKSDRPCMIPEEFTLATEQRARLREQQMKAHGEDNEGIERSSFRTHRNHPVPVFSNGTHDSFNQYQLGTPRPSHMKSSVEDRHRGTKSVNKDDFSFDKSGFKPVPLPNFSKPFKPRVGVAPLTEVVDVHLNSTARAHKREEFDAYLKNREHVRELIKHQQEEDRRKKEMEEIAELRKKMVFKARPLPGCSQSTVRKSAKTTPVTKFAITESTEKTKKNLQNYF